jgi:hypothetical protein
MSTTPIADCKQGRFTATSGDKVTVYANAKTVNGQTSFGRTVKGEVFNPDFAIKGHHWR